MTSQLGNPKDIQMNAYPFFVGWEPISAHRRAHLFKSIMKPDSISFPRHSYQGSLAEGLRKHSLGSQLIFWTESWILNYTGRAIDAVDSQSLIINYVEILVRSEIDLKKLRYLI